MIAATPLLLTRWASQAGRAPDAFAPENAQLDPRDLPDLLADIARTAADIPFHDDAGAVDGNWRRVLLADQSFVLALLATAAIDARAEALDALLDGARSGGSPRENEARLTGLVEALLSFADDLDAWLAPADLGGATRGQSIRRLAENVIERVLGLQLQRLADHVAEREAAELTDRFRHEQDHWHEHRQALRPWHRAVLEGEVRGVAEAVERAWADRMLGELADAVEAFVEEMRELGRRAAGAFEASLASGDHSPHPALVIAFARMFAHARHLLNDVPQQLIDFYQLRLLHTAPASARPDRMLLAVVPRPRSRPKLPKGMLIPAGKGIAFATDTVLDVTGASLCEARLWRPGAEGGTVTRFAAGPDGALGDAVSGIATPLPGTAFETHAIFSTPLLDLPGGTRRVRLELDLDCAVDAALAATLGFSVTTAKGWLAVPASIVPIDTGLQVTVTLPADFAALTGCPAAFAAPALRLTHGAGAPFDARLLAARVTIAVKDVPGLEVRTPLGLASSSAAAPFGAPPWPGGWLRVDHPVLAGPPLDRLVLRFDWAGLPPGQSGFASYYRGYVVDEQGQLFDWPPFDNAAFTVTLAAPVRGWDAAHRLPLFAPASLDTAPPVSAAPPPDIFDAEFEPAPPLTPERGPLAPGSWLAAAARDADGAIPDHVCVTLAGPTHGFGHALHAANVQYATEAIARGDTPPARPGLLRRLLRAILSFPARLLRRIEGAEMVEPGAPDAVAVLLPNPPFQPLLSGIALDYARIVESEGLTFHHATTLDTPEERPLGGAMLFPAGPDALTLDLCFDGATPGDELALLVRLAAVTPASLDPLWSYRAATDWRPLPAAALRADQAQGFATTGILRIAIPADAAEPVSLRLAFSGADPPAIVAILPDAVSATRLIDGSERAMPPVAAGTVTRLAGLARVLQPLDTAGGQPPEAPAMLRARAAERVRHRGRAVTGWDVERLVLAEFPDIARVRVLTEGDPAREAASAEIRVVVIPVPGVGDPLRPSAAPRLRAGITDRLVQLASPFANIAVIDPVYAPVDVAARLILDSGDTEGVEAALVALLSPWATPGLDLPDHADADRVRAAIARFLLQQPQVRAIDRLNVTLHADGSGWQVPVAGEIAVTGIAALATASW
ncbi:hypothetical protein [Sphingomonas sp. LM7]|uniref:hypothetical protein n=1 Tax=Sphingomonas sp. LM7 TaxID=1938607 RepID=UPI000983C222|nr:hypothetical protein [Sphingomonas sp. LM7]AQR73698.1 hypothetical protein BXU08_08645 [Sphingomonas sp. LM7]